MTRGWTIGLLLAHVLAVAVGCGGSSDKSAGSLGKSLGQNVTEFAQGVGQGVDSQLQIRIELSDELTSSGLTVTVAKQESTLDDSSKPVSVYFVAKQKFGGTLIAKAYNSQDMEIGRATADVAFEADDARYVTFAFPSEMDRQLVAFYQIGRRATAPSDDAHKSEPSDDARKSTPSDEASKTAPSDEAKK